MRLTSRGTPARAASSTERRLQVGELSTCTGLAAWALTCTALREAERATVGLAAARDSIFASCVVEGGEARG